MSAHLVFIHARRNEYVSVCVREYTPHWLVTGNWEEGANNNGVRQAQVESIIRGLLHELNAGHNTHASFYCRLLLWQKVVRERWEDGRGSRNGSIQTRELNWLWAWVCLKKAITVCYCAYMHMFLNYECFVAGVCGRCKCGPCLTATIKAFLLIAACLPVKYCHFILPSWPTNCKITVTPSITNVYLDV